VETDTIPTDNVAEEENTVQSSQTEAKVHKSALSTESQDTSVGYEESTSSLVQDANDNRREDRNNRTKSITRNDDTDSSILDFDTWEPEVIDKDDSNLENEYIERYSMKDIWELKKLADEEIAFLEANYPTTLKRSSEIETRQGKPKGNGTFTLIISKTKKVAV
jgi:hypothetical protein